MLVVAGTITFDPAHHETVVDAARIVAESTRLESGCSSYEFFSDLTLRGRLLVFEEWEGETQLLNHLESDHVAQFGAVLRASGMKSRDITRYHVSTSEPNRPS
ncbi:MAG: putative quinol monooxygenase [Acidimicrobiia bacterium]